MADPVLVVSDLSVQYGDTMAVRDVSFTVHAGEVVAISGASGAGKTSIVLAIMGLLPQNADVFGSVNVHGVDVLKPTRLPFRGRLVGMIPQDPYSWFNPVTRLGKQIVEIVRDRSLSRNAAVERSHSLLEVVGLPVRRAVRSYPHELSGGMRQRAAIATAIAHSPPLLLADEPTSALDAASRDHILDLLGSLREQGKALLLISHDESVIRGLADRVLHLVDGTFQSPSELVATSVAQFSRDEPTGPVVMDISGVSKSFGPISVLDRLDLAVREGETVAVVGPSGCGKTTLCRILAGLEAVDSGTIVFEGNDRGNLDRLQRAKYAQLVFQDTAGALDPRRTIAQTVAEALVIHGVASGERSALVDSALTQAGLPLAYKRRLPAELSGGERQRVGIARALVLRPKVLLLDEPFSALDTETRRGIQDRLRQLQVEHGLAYLLVTHDEGAVREFAHRVVHLK